MVGREGVAARGSPAGASWGAGAGRAQSLHVGRTAGLGPRWTAAGWRCGGARFVGVCGVGGERPGRSMIEVLAGLRQPDLEHECCSRARMSRRQGPNPRREKGLSYIPEDRHGRGLVLPFSLTENLLLGNAEVSPFSQGGQHRLPRHARTDRSASCRSLTSARLAGDISGRAFRRQPAKADHRSRTAPRT